MSAAQFDMLMASIAGMDREVLIWRLRGLDCRFKIDFTDEYLHTLSLERLRHIVLSAGMHAAEASQGQPQA